MLIPCSKCRIDVLVDEGIASVLCPLCSMGAASEVTPGTPSRKPRAPYGSKTRNGVKIDHAAAKKGFIRVERPKDPTKKGRGWHLKGFFEFQGKTFSFGQEITGEAVEAAKAHYGK